MSTGEARGSTTLYSPRLLALSAELANFPLDTAFQLVGDTRSRTCGSTIKIGLNCGTDGAVTKIGLQVAACAVGQSSAAILARGITGRDEPDLRDTVTQIELWLAGGGDPPDWPDFDALGAARAHPGRHGALLLPWKAAAEALSSRNTAG